MSSELPLVSIVITSYNRAHWVGQSIQSALDQDYPNLEIIISDNASTDNSDQVIRSYCQDRRIKYSRNEKNIGMLANFRKTFFKLAKGDYITNISSDDYLVDNKFISSSIEIVNSEKNILLVFGKYHVLNEHSNKTIFSPISFYYSKKTRKGLEVFFDFPKYPYFGWAGCLLNRNKLSDPQIGISESVTSDIGANLKMMLRGDVGFIDRNVYVIRVHSNNETSRQRTVKELIEGRLNMFDNIQKMYRNIYGTDEKIERWRFNMLRKDTTDFLIHFLLTNRKLDYNEFLEYCSTHNIDIYNSIVNKDLKYRVVKSIIIPIAKVNLFRKLAHFLFPNRSVFAVKYS
jgi:glycosyltransferase involved in cell wall biosynthesis